MTSRSVSHRQVGPPLTIGDIVVEAIEHTVVHVQVIDDALVGVAVKQPLAVVIRAPTMTFTMSLECPEPGDHDGSP